MNKKYILALFFLIFSVFILFPVEVGFSQVILDSDGDGYDDEAEIKNGYSPYNSAAVEIKDSDVDQDGLSDYWEIQFGTDPYSSDSDSDGYSDFLEIDNAYNPLSSLPQKLSQKIEINLEKQELYYMVADNPWKIFIVSTGKPGMDTPKGVFTIVNKNKKAWSSSYSLWMPYWLGLDRGRIGIHELPVWPSGYREGSEHIGIPVSHGCIRLGVGPAQYIYERMSIGAEVIIR